jgi:four helix bundle protein
MNKNDLMKRTKDFAHACVKLALELPGSILGNHIKGQLIRSVTSVAANYRATCVAQSKKSFIAKISIVIEEADESYFWIEFIIDEKMLKRERCEKLMQEAYELTSIFIASRKTASRNL